MANQIAKTTQSLTTAEDMRETTKMLMRPNANWEEYLTPAPVSVTIMAELVFISSSEDFSINVNPPQGGFKHIKYPNSFRASLMQVCNLGWQAFNQAHKNMDQIRIYTASVPDHIKAAVSTLFSPSDEVVKNLLPSQLDNIRNTAEDCLTLAEGVEEKYMDVIHLIQELLEACINAKHFYGEELEKVKMSLAETKLREQTARQLKERYQKAVEDLEKQMDEAQDSFNSAMESLPSGWDMIGMDFVEGITSAITGILNGFVSIVTGASAGGLATTSDGSSPNFDFIEKIKVFSKSGQILTLAGFIKDFVKGGAIDWKNIYNREKKECTKAKWVDQQFKRIIQKLTDMPEEKLRDQALSICQTGVEISAEMETYTPETEWDDEKTTALVTKIPALYEKALTFDSSSKKNLGSPALAPKPPMMYKTESSSEPQRASQRATESARFRIEQSRVQLEYTRTSYEKSVQNMERNEKELNDILVEMQRCNIKEIDFDTTIKMLVKGMDAMAKVKEQWEKMVLFFQMVSNIVKASLSNTMNHFVTTSENTQRLGYNNKLFTKDLLYNQAFQASNVASLVHMISAAYTEVSAKYLMDRVSNLGNLMSMDINNPEFLQKRAQLHVDCQDAQRGILELVTKHKEDFEKKTFGRLEKIESELLAVLPEALPQETEKMNKIVLAGFEGLQDYF